MTRKSPAKPPMLGLHARRVGERTSSAALRCDLAFLTADADGRSVQRVLVRTHVRLAVLLVVLVLVAALGAARLSAGQTSSVHYLTVANPKMAQQRLDGMSVPSGFQRVACAHAAKPSVCFSAFPSLALSSANWAQIIERLGIRITNPSGCSDLRRLRVGHATAVNCLAIGYLGRDQIWSDSLGIERVTRAGLRPTSARYGSFTGTLITITDLGR